jgi:hypothetical protein
MTKEDFLAINPGFKRRVTDPPGQQLLIPVANEASFLEKLASLPAEKRAGRLLQSSQRRHPVQSRNAMT